MIVRHLFLISIVFCKAVIIASTPASAMELEIQPRVEAGIMFYSFELGAISKISMPVNHNTTSHNFTQEKKEFGDTMGFVIGGATVFLNRFYLDFSLRSAVDGNDTARFRWSSYNEDTNNGGSRYLAMDSDIYGTFHKKDVTLSLGIPLGDQLSLYLGYKWSTLDVEQTFQGPYSDYGVLDYLAVGTARGNEHLQFEYEGPFVGIIHGWQVDWSSTYMGLVSVNIGLAALNSTIELDRNIYTRFDSVIGSGIEQTAEQHTSKKHEYTGEALGITLGVGWQGRTWIEDLTYTLAVNTYRYNFDMDQPTFDTATESSVQLKIGIIYTF